jgi:hypothetical protein
MPSSFRMPSQISPCSRRILIGLRIYRASKNVKSVLNLGVDAPD